MAATTDIGGRNDEGAKTSQEPHVVSPFAITALSKALRESMINFRFSRDTSGGINSYDFGAEEIKELMQLVDDARKALEKCTRNRTNESVNDDNDLDLALASAWNHYLSSLCDRALDTKNPSDAGLGTAAKLVMENDSGDIIDSNIMSYNNVLVTAAKVQNTTLVDTMWKNLMAKQEHQHDFQFSIKPNSVTYNARLMSTNDDSQRLAILDKEIIPAAFRLQRQSANFTSTTDLVIDSFTVDMMIMPLLKSNRKKHLFQLIDHWMTLKNRQHNTFVANTEDQKQQRNSKKTTERAFKNAMAAFFITLVQKNGDVRTARELWNRYMILNIDDCTESGDVSGCNQPNDAFLRATNIVSPERRHYNILLDGYARLVDQVRDRQARKLDRTPDTEPSSSNEKATRKTKIWEASASSEDDDEENGADATSTSEFFAGVQEKAIHDGQELFALMMAQQQQTIAKRARNTIGPDAYTKSTMVRLCRNGSEVQEVMYKTSDAFSSTPLNANQVCLPRAVTRAAVTTCGRLGDPSMACVIFDQYMFSEVDCKSQNHLSNYRAFNVLLGSLAAGAKLDNSRLDVIPTTSEGKTPPAPSFLLSKLQGLTCTEAILCVLNIMTSKNSQTYCVAASGLQYAPIHERERLSQNNTNATTIDPLALQIFHNATRDGIHADGRLVNAIFRCYGDDIAGALDGWKAHIRKATNDYEEKTSARSRAGTSKKKNLLAAYNGLIYVCGRAERPDIAVRIVYAMKNKEGLDPSENPYNNYRSGKSTRQNLVKRDKVDSSWRGMLPKLDMVGQYENILFVECKKYDTRDRRMEKDNRIRIIV
jgi:hypothetical protein